MITLSKKMLADELKRFARPGQTQEERELLLVGFALSAGIAACQTSGICVHQLTQPMVDKIYRTALAAFAGDSPVSELEIARARKNGLKIEVIP